MERESFLFYKSFYEAIKPLSKDIQGEIYTAIMEYALYGNLSERLKPVANSVFTLIRPILDANLKRYSCGKRGGRPTQQSDDESHAQSYAEEVELMLSDADLKKSVCADYGISEQEYADRLSRFLRHCNDAQKARGKNRHDNLADAQKHLRYWMSKAYISQESKIRTQAETPPQDYDFSGGFGGLDN